ncbi:serine hydrolase-like protein 2 isoform X3 [Lepidochelys kempii]|uniref:serine hydrolase-like protein 2 isoform X3 n=1 Tax=Lepidochelys kempii TaxID=8472 RepID=UPI003C701AF1
MKDIPSPARSRACPGAGPAPTTLHKRDRVTEPGGLTAARARFLFGRGPPPLKRARAAAGFPRALPGARGALLKSSGRSPEPRWPRFSSGRNAPVRRRGAQRSRLPSARTGPQQCKARLSPRLLYITFTSWRSAGEGAGLGPFKRCIHRGRAPSVWFRLQLLGSGCLSPPLSAPSRLRPRPVQLLVALTQLCGLLEAPGDREDEMPSVLKWSSLPVAGMVSEMKFPVPWGHIAAKAWGSPQGHPMLCLHGWLDNANTFNRLIPLLPKDYCYMAMDFGGHGLSSHRPAGFPYHFLDYVSEVRRVTAALKWSRFTLMGHSLGGSVAGMFSCIFPEMVDKLILVESYGFFPAPQGQDKGPGLGRERTLNSPLPSRDEPSKSEESGTWLDSKRKVIESLLSLEENKPQPPKVRSPQEALQRLLQANSHLTEESGRILLQRGATEVLGGLVYNRDMRVLKHNLDPLTLEQFVSFLRKIQASVLMIIAQDGIFNPEAENMSRYFVKPLQEAFQSNLKLAILRPLSDGSNLLPR